MNRVCEEMRRVSLMTGKSCRVFIRKTSTIYLAIFSAVLVLGSIAFISYIMKGSFTLYSTSDPYESLEFYISCSGQNTVQCQPVTTSTKQKMTPSELLFDILSPKLQANMSWTKKAEV